MCACLTSVPPHQLVQGYMNLKLGVDKVFVEMDEDYDDAIVEMTAEQAIEVIKRNERGRQGKQRALLVKEVRADERKQRLYDATMPASIDKDPSTAASDIQKVWRGYLSRIKALRAREEELVFIGMRPGPVSGALFVVCCLLLSVVDDNATSPCCCTLFFRRTPWTHSS